MDFLRVRLKASRERVTALRDFYAALGVESHGADRYVVGATELAFNAVPDYHFALLVPGDRFDAALAWARGSRRHASEREPAQPART